MLLGAILRLGRFPSPDSPSQFDEVGYLSNGLLLLEGETPINKYAPSGPLTWLSAGYGGVKSLFKLLALIVREFRHANAWKRAVRPAETNGLLCRNARLQRRFALLAVEHFVDLVRSDRLRPEHVAGMIGLFVEAVGSVAVEHRTAEGHVIDAVAIDADCEMATGHHHFEFPIARLAEQRDALRFAIPAAVVFQLLVDLRHPFRFEQAFVDPANHILLILRVETARHVGLGDLPIVRHASSQQSAIFIDVIPTERHNFGLFRCQRFVKFFDQRFRRCFFRSSRAS